MDRVIPDIIYKINERAYYDRFARKVIDHFANNLDRTNVGPGSDSVYDLKKSMRYSLFFDGNRRISRIRIEYSFYGLFIDLGVGRGVPLEDIGYQKIGRSLLGRKVKGRRAKRWYLKTIYGQTIRLMTIVSAQRGSEWTVLMDTVVREMENVNLEI